jgi:hypothetical protein
MSDGDYRQTRTGSPAEDAEGTEKTLGRETGDLDGRSPFLFFYHRGHRERSKQRRIRCKVN